MSFTYPSAWTASPPKGPSELHFQPLVYLSTQRHETVGGDCRTIAADRTIDVEMPAMNLELTACLRGPGIAQAEKSVDALLASTTFASQ